MTIKEIDDQILKLQILRKSLEKEEIKKFQEEAKKNVGRCFILNGRYLKIIDIPREECDMCGHYHFNKYQYTALYLGQNSDFDDVVPFYCDTVFSSVVGETNNITKEDIREISEEEFMAEFDRYAKELREKVVSNALL